MYKPVKGLPVCTEANNPKFRWQRSDPKNGVDVQIWRQNVEEISCSTTITCKMACPGVYKPGPDDTKGKCYTYDVLTAICIEIGLTVDYDKAEEVWEYKGGCYTNDQVGLYERATPGKVYEFDYIPIEVRMDADPFNVVSKTPGVVDGSNSTDLSFFAWLSWVAFSLAIIGSLVFGLSYLSLKKMQ